jgi:hypothetical protein
VRRVQLWRKDHPGYWKKNKPSSQATHPIECQSSNPDQSSRNALRALPGTLQEDCLTQHPAFIGLISMVTGSTLQDDIDRTARQLLAKGRDILGLVNPPGRSRQPSFNYDQQTSPSTGSDSSDPG